MKGKWSRLTKLQQKVKRILAEDIRWYLQLIHGEWVNLGITVDTLKSGNPTNKIRRVTVGWVGYTLVLQKALGLMFITHEPTCHIPVMKIGFEYLCVLRRN